jgi:hypothetical protein
VGWAALTTVHFIRVFDNTEVTTLSVVIAGHISLCSLGLPVVLCNLVSNNRENSIRSGEWIWLVQSGWVILFTTSPITGVGGYSLFILFLICQLFTCLLSVGALVPMIYDYIIGQWSSRWTEVVGALIGVVNPILIFVNVLHSDIAI